MRIEIARNVIEHLKNFPFGFPASPDHEEWRLLEVPFSVTDEEGELLSKMMPFSEQIDDMAKRLGRRKEELLPLLDGLIHKTWLLRTGTRENGRYTALTFGPGASELQMPWLSKELMEVQRKASGPPEKPEPAGTIPYFRIMPREAALSNTTEVLPSEIVSHIIEQADENELAVTECICRKTAKIHGKGCSNPMDDQCLFFGGFAVAILELNAGRRVTKEEAKKRMKRAQELGLVHQTNANARPLVICSCCTCCCAALGAFVANRPTMAWKSNFLSQVNIETCKGTCPECVKMCPVKACTIDKKTMRPSIDLSRCIGCGICVAACPEKALKLKRKEESFIYPDTWDDYIHLRLKQTGRDIYFK